MTINDLLLNVKDVSFSSCICQKDIQTEEDRVAYIHKGYNVPLIETEFRKEFPSIDPANICYSPSYGLMCFYFNRETLAVSPFHLDVILNDSSPIPDFKQRCLDVIDLCEKAAAEGNYASAITTLQDRMRLEFFGLLVKKHGTTMKDLYKQFFDAYLLSDYGFNGMDTAMLNEILQCKTEEDNKKTEQAISDLPEVLTVYRGANSKSTYYRKAYSWTLDINTANFFAARHGTGLGHIVKGKIHKSDIIEAFRGEDGRGEEEIIVDPKNVHVIEEIPVFGMELLTGILPKITPLYHSYRDKLKNLPFLQESVDHGKLHEARVLLLTQIIAELMELPMLERRLLATAAIYHDTQRSHDGEDAMHGALAAKYYHNTVSKPDPVVEFLCKYHCLPDEEGYTEIRNNRKLSKNRTLVTRLYNIFKDADALDRARFGIQDLDLNQLRLPISQELTLVARLCYEQIKL